MSIIEAALEPATNYSNDVVIDSKYTEAARREFNEDREWFVSQTGRHDSGFRKMLRTYVESAVANGHHAIAKGVAIDLCVMYRAQQMEAKENPKPLRIDRASEDKAKRNWENSPEQLVEETGKDDIVFRLFLADALRNADKGLAYHLCLLYRVMENEYA